MKKFFTNPEIEVIKFANEDIVTTSELILPDEELSLLLDLDA